MTTYTLPVDQTTLTQFMVEVTTEKDECYAYYLFMDPDEGDHPGTTAMNWCNEDEMEDDSDDRADSYSVEEYGVFDNPNCLPQDINTYLQRYQGEGVRIVGDLIEFDNFDYAWIPNGFDALDTDEYETVEEWATYNELDLRVA